jgi:hypothetical protein
MVQTFVSWMNVYPSLLSRRMSSGIRGFTSSGRGINTSCATDGV